MPLDEKKGQNTLLIDSNRQNNGVSLKEIQESFLKEDGMNTMPKYNTCPSP